EAKLGVLWLFEGDAFRAVALHGPAEFVEARQRNPILPLIPGTALGRVAATKQTVQIADVQAEPAYRVTPATRIGVETGGLRTLLSVPMLRRVDRHLQPLSPRGLPVHRQADRVGQEFRQSGGHRDR